MCCMRLAGNAEPQKIAKNSPSGHHHTTLSGYIFATKARINNQKKKLVKQQCLPHRSSLSGELRPTGSWDLLAHLGTAANFNGFHVLGALCTAEVEHGKFNSLYGRLLSLSTFVCYWVWVYNTKFCRKKLSPGHCESDCCLSTLAVALPNPDWFSKFCCCKTQK